MDAATLNARVYAGYGKAAYIIAPQVEQFRPTGPSNPLEAPLGTINAAFDQTAAFSLTKPWNRQKAEGFALVDATLLAIGDYLVDLSRQSSTPAQPVTVNGSPLTVGGVVITITNSTAPTGDPVPGLSVDIYFVERLELYRPTEVVLCNTVLSISRPQEQDAPGEGGYGGRTQTTDVTLASGWPASLLPKGRGDTPPTKLPLDTRASAFDVLLPQIPGVQIEPGDRFTDAVGLEYVIYSVQSSPFGYWLQAGVATT